MALLLGAPDYSVAHDATRLVEGVLANSRDEKATAEYGIGLLGASAPPNTASAHFRRARWSKARRIARNLDPTQFLAERALKTCRGRHRGNSRARHRGAVKVRAIGGSMAERNDQADRCCRLRLVNRNIGASHDTCTDASDGQRYDHANRCGLAGCFLIGYQRQNGAIRLPVVIFGDKAEVMFAVTDRFGILLCTSDGREVS